MSKINLQHTAAPDRPVTNHRAIVLQRRFRADPAVLGLIAELAFGAADQPPAAPTHSHMGGR